MIHEMGELVTAGIDKAEVLKVFYASFLISSPTSLTSIMRRIGGAKSLPPYATSKFEIIS